MIHQDIKPENIFVEETGKVRLLDFGIAHQLAEERHWWSRFTRAPLVGTPDYMAPERLVGQKGSVRSDVYAVGVVLYEMLCGRTPFQETDGFAIVSIHSSHEPPTILSINPTLSPALATVVMRAIRRDPPRRYASIQDLQCDFAHIDKVNVVSYVPDPPLIGGRYRQAISLTGLIFLLCYGLIAFGVFAQYIHQLAH